MVLSVPRLIFQAGEFPKRNDCHKSHTGGEGRHLRGVSVVGFAEMVLRPMVLGDTG